MVLNIKANSQSKMPTNKVQYIILPPSFCSAPSAFPAPPPPPPRSRRTVQRWKIRIWSLITVPGGCFGSCECRAVSGWSRLGWTGARCCFAWSIWSSCCFDNWIDNSFNLFFLKDHGLWSRCWSFGWSWLWSGLRLWLRSIHTGVGTAIKAENDWMVSEKNSTPVRLTNTVH